MTQPEPVRLREEDGELYAHTGDLADWLDKTCRHIMYREGNNIDPHALGKLIGLRELAKALRAMHLTMVTIPDSLEGMPPLEGEGGSHD